MGSSALPFPQSGALQVFFVLVHAAPVVICSALVKCPLGPVWHPRRWLGGRPWAASLRCIGGKEVWGLFLHGGAGALGGPSVVKLAFLSLTEPSGPGSRKVQTSTNDQYKVAHSQPQRASLYHLRSPLPKGVIGAESESLIFVKRKC